MLSIRFWKTSVRCILEFVITPENKLLRVSLYLTFSSYFALMNVAVFAQYFGLIKKLNIISKKFISKLENLTNDDVKAYSSFSIIIRCPLSFFISLFAWRAFCSSVFTSRSTNTEMNFSI